MKESTTATKVMIGVLCAGVLLYLALYFLLGFRENLVTTVAYNYTVDVGREAQGVIVRQETVLSTSGAYVDLVPGEGEKVAAGEAVALVYSDPAALDARQSIRLLSAELEQLRAALNVGELTAGVTRLDEQVVASIITLRSLAAGGDLSSLEDSAQTLRSMVFQRDYAYGDEEAAAQLARLIEDKQSQLDALRRSLSGVSQTIYAPASGVFSGTADGYESRITPAMLDTLTMGELQTLLAQAVPTAAAGAGKLITDSTWYFAALMDGQNELSLTQGRQYTVSFSHDFYGEVTMTLERLETDGAQTLAIFSAREHLADTTLLREQTVDVVVAQLTGIRIPRRALRVETETVTHEDGTTTQENTYGVYTVVGTQAEWQTVNVLHTGDTYYLVEPANPDATVRLRPGDTVILSASGLYDGKVVR